MAYTFFKALGLPTGQVAGRGRQARRRARHHHARQGARRRAQSARRSCRRRRIDAAAPTAVLKVNDAAIGDRMGLDIGPETTRLYAHRLTRCEDRRLERPDGRLRDRRVRRGHARRRAGGRQRQGHDDHRRRRLGGGRQQGRASPIASPTSRPAVARRWSFSADRRCRASRRCRRSSWTFKVRRSCTVQSGPAMLGRSRV